MSHFQRWNNISVKLKYTLWKKIQCKPWHQAHRHIAGTLELLDGFRLAWLCCHLNSPYGFLLLQWLQNKLLSDTGNLSPCLPNMKNNQRSHISEMATLDQVNNVKKNKWRHTLEKNFHTAKKLSATSNYKYVWSFSLIEVSEVSKLQKVEV